MSFFKAMSYTFCLYLIFSIRTTMRTLMTCMRCILSIIVITIFTSSTAFGVCITCAGCFYNLMFCTVLTHITRRRVISVRICYSIMATLAISFIHRAYNSTSTFWFQPPSLIADSTRLTFFKVSISTFNSVLLSMTYFITFTEISLTEQKEHNQIKWV